MRPQLFPAGVRNCIYRDRSATGEGRQSRRSAALVSQENFHVALSQSGLCRDTELCRARRCGDFPWLRGNDRRGRRRTDVPSKTIIENAVNSKDHTTLVAAVKATDLVDTLQGEGPFTVFAPVNKAFDKLPKGTMESLLKPENKAGLTAILTYHVIPAKISAADFIAAIKRGGGEASYKTVEGEALTVRQNGRRLEIIDAKGDKSFVTIADVVQKNGVIHVVDTVLLPKS